jgi:hypothetical protein
MKMCENGNFGQQLHQMCKHGMKHHKHIKNMQICANGMKYCMELVECGELDAIQCEKCVIGWLCDDPVETCMNPEDTMQWWQQCVQTNQFWLECIEKTLNHMDWMEFMNHHWYYGECIKSIVKCMKKHNLAFKLVETPPNQTKGD